MTLRQPFYYELSNQKFQLKIELQLQKMVIAINHSLQM